MKMKTMKLSALAFAALTIGLISCDKEDTPNPKPTISSFAPTAAFAGDTVIITGTNFTGATAVSFGNSAAASFIVSDASSIKAVVGTGATGDVKVTTPAGSATLTGFTLNVSAPSIAVTDSIRVSFSATKPYTFFSFKDSAIVANSDSATTKWDFGVRYVSIIVNSHTSGPGNAGVIVQPGIYDDFTTAPGSGYAYDTTATQPAINTGLTTGWYNYNTTTHAFNPKAGQFFVFRSADNHYVKMEITAVDYADFVGQTPETLIYKFRYTYQADGSRNF